MGKTIDQLTTTLTAATITDPSVVRVGVGDSTSGSAVSKKMAASELMKLSPFDVVADVTALLAVTHARDNQLFQTRGYSAEGVGANLYRYDAGSSATIDGGFVLPGIGGTLSFSGTTFNGTAGTGRFIAVDQTIADASKFGALGDASADDTQAIRLATAALTDGGELYVPPGTYLVNPVTYGPTINANNVLIRGAGASTIIRGTRTSDDAGNQFYNMFEADAKTGITLKDMRFERYITALLTTDCDNVTVENISGDWHIPNASNYYADKPLSFYGTSNIRVVNCHFENFFFAVYLGGDDTNNRCNNVTVTGCTFEHTRASSFTATFPVGVYAYYADNVTVTGNTFLNIYSSVENGSPGTGMGYGVYEGDGDCRSITITGNSFRFDRRAGKRAMAVYLSTAETGNVTGNSIFVDSPAWKFFTADDTTDVISCVAHGFVDGDAIVVESSNTIPAGLTNTGTYYVRDATADTFKVATTSGGSAIDITSTGSGNHVVSTVINTLIRIQQDRSRQRYTVSGNTARCGGRDFFVNVISSSLNNNVSIVGNVITGGQIRLDGSNLSGTVTATAASDILTKSSHKLFNGDRVMFDSTGTLPAGLSATTSYFVINRTANTFQVSTTLGGAAVDITDTGSGTHTVYPLDSMASIVVSSNAIADGLIPAVQATASSDLTPYKGLLIQGNSVNRCGWTAILMNAGCLRSRIVDNVIVDCNLLNKSTYAAAVCLFGKSHGSFISGNTARNTLGGGGHAKYFLEHTYNSTDRLFVDRIYNNSIDRMETATYFRFHQASPTSQLADVNYGDQCFRCPPAAGNPHYWTCNKFYQKTLTATITTAATTVTVASTSGLTAGDIVLLIENPLGIDWQYSDTTKWHQTTIASVTDGTHFELTDAIPSGETYTSGKSEVRIAKFTAASNL